MKIIWRILRSVLIADLVILAIAFGYTWIKGPWALATLSSALCVAGLSVLGLGCFSFLGGTTMSRGALYMHSRSAGVENQQARLNQDAKDSASSYSFLLTATLSGIIAILLGFALIS